MSKERLEELHKFYINGIINVDELVEEFVKLEQLNWALINQNKRYREELDILGEVINSAPNADKLNEEYERLKGLEGEE